MYLKEKAEKEKLMIIINQQTKASALEQHKI
jgi:hypothetical protein